MSFCNHDIKCRPDFYFKEFIVDAKIGGNADRQRNQVERYLEHKPKLIIVTLNDKIKKQIINDKEIIIMSIKSFFDYLNLKNIDYEKLRTKLDEIKYYHAPEKDVAQRSKVK